MSCVLPYNDSLLSFCFFNLMWQLLSGHLNVVLQLFMCNLATFFQYHYGANCLLKNSYISVLSLSVTFVQLFHMFQCDRSLCHF